MADFTTYALKLQRTLRPFMTQSITVEQPTVALDDSGGVSRTWATRKTLTACVQEASAQKRRDLAMAQIDISHDIYCIEDPTIEVGDRILYGSRVLELIGVRNMDNLDVLWHIEANEFKET